jgi:hypothetical protein
MAPSKVAEQTFVQNLLFAFFGHLPNYRDISRGTGAQRVEAINELLRLLNMVYVGILTNQFDRVRHPWITPEFIDDNFAGRKLNQYYQWICAEKVRYTHLKAMKFRNTFAAICSVARDIFADRYAERYHDPESYAFVETIRSILSIDGPADKYRRQLVVLGRLEHELKRMVSKPQGPISFDDENQPIIRTKRREYFPSAQTVAIDESYIIGRFLVYRRVFAVVEAGREFIREYLVIEKKPFGLVFRWETRGGPGNQAALFSGIGFFVSEAWWLIGYSAAPFQRMRMMAANTAEWRNHKNDTTRFCTGEVLSHREEDKAPQSRSAVLIREEENSWKDEPFSDRVRFLSDLELGHLLKEEEISIIRGR